MALEKIQISGYRGFKELATVNFAVPVQNKEGSGLSIITGANNSGKSTILECLRARSGYNTPSFSSGVRNASTEFINIVYSFTDIEERIHSIQKGSSEAIHTIPRSDSKIFCLPSRRTFSPFFGKGGINDRQTRIQQFGLPSARSPMLDGFESRLFKITSSEELKTEFNKLLSEVLGFTPDWAIDLSEQGGYFLKFFNSGHSHSSDGLGEGIVSIFSIIDSLYDSTAKDIIVIDEPELSLHPSLQRRLSDVFYRYSKDRQIIISTHSPYFINISALKNGAKITRVISTKSGSKVHQLTPESTEAINKLSSGNIYNPHTFGLDARELFFQDDGIILTEGQEDVVLFPQIANSLEKKISGNFFGWGAGGAGNIIHLCKILSDLGFKKVTAILDGDKLEATEKLRPLFPNYNFCNIPADDIRTKSAREATEEKAGLLDKKNNIRREHIESIKTLFESINKYMRD
ncbi:AAA family ATPase [Pseudomonas aeruginosa]